MAKKDKKLQAITPAMCEGSGLVRFRNEFPKRYHDVGIAEQHAVTFAAGLACEGERPVVAIYSSYLQRAYDQLIHDVALQNLNVLFAIDRAGIVGEDGATHAGSFDLSFMRCVPNMVIMAPSSENECYAMLEAGFKHKGPVAVRYPRGGGLGNYDKEKIETIEIGKAKIIRNGKSASRRSAILSFGALLSNCEKAAHDLDATLVDMRFAKPLDEELLRKLSDNHKYFVTVEDNAIAGGAGSAVNEFVLNNKLEVKVKNLGLPDKFTEHGTRAEILSDAGLDEENILKSVTDFINS
jgi:1-deoxy-D-xylulose-5-phosphate synthase